MPRKLSPDKFVLRLLETTATPVYLVDSERTVAYANLACEAWTGLESEALLGRRCDYAALAETAAVNEPSLAPPPEAFAGQICSGYVSGALDEGRLRLAQFFPLTPPEALGATLVLAAVGAESFTPEQIEASQVTAADSRRLHAQLIEMRSSWKRKFKSAPFIGVGPASERVRQQIRLAASAANRVLVTGPSGSGRDHVVKAIHYGQPGEPGPLVPVDCELLDTELMQQALAAFVKKHSTGKRSGAALLLQGVDQLPAAAQHELVEFLRLPGIDLTILATSTRSLQKLAKHGRIDSALAQALGTLVIDVPPLCARPEDIPVLAQHFVELSNSAGKKQYSGFSVDALDELSGYQWPGNVRELSEVIQECCSSAVGPYITPADLPDRFRHAEKAVAHASRALEPIQLDDFLAGIERELLERALAASKGNKTKAAGLLGIHRARLIRRLIQLGLVEASPVDSGTEEPVIFEPVEESEPR